jgi:hypothetical protein
MAEQRDSPSIDVLAERIAGMEKATKLAYEELKEHLERLNHAHRDAAARDAFFLPREAHEQFFNEYRLSLDGLKKDIDKCTQREQFDQFFRDFGHWRDEVNGKLSQQAGATTNTRLWMAVITLILLAVSVLARWVLK